MIQVNRNGTGTTSGGTLIHHFGGTDVGNSCNLPPGGTGNGLTANTFVIVPAIKGSCNTEFAGGTTVATFPDPRTDTSGTWNCSDQVLLIDGNNGTNSIKTVQDLCPVCADSRYNHIDTYSTNTACDAHSFVDYGQFYGIKNR